MTSKVAALSRYIWPSRSCIEGPKVAAYERAFAEATGSRYALGFWKGRVAFYAALRALGIGPDDEVIMPGYTCMVVPAAVMFLGAKPVYVDIEPSYGTLDPDGLSAALTPRTKAIMIQHTYGWPSAGIGRVQDFAARHGLVILEDCCHALGTRQGGRHVGNFGVAGFFSSQWSKPYTTGLGGMLVCNDPDFYERVRALREEAACWPAPKVAAQLALQGIIFDLSVYPATMAIARHSYRFLSVRSIITGSTDRCEYTGWQDDYFQRMCEVQAAAGLCELRHLDQATRHRRRLGTWYWTQLQELGWPVPPWPENSDVTLLRFPVRVQNKAEAMRTADRHFVEIGEWFIRPLHSHLAPQEAFGYRTGMCPHAEQAAREIINLPTHPRVSQAHARRVMRFLQRCTSPVVLPGS